jgi:5-methylthioribose kinase
LKYKFLTEAQCLLHGDLHTGSVFASADETKIFDAEFAFVGPMAFDIGLLVGNILINYVSWSGKDDPANAIRDYRDYLIETIEQIYLLFRDKFEKNGQKDAREIIAGIPGFREDFFRALFEDMIGYAATVMIRRMHGLAHNIDVDGIEDLEVRKDVQIMVLELAEELMMNRGSLMDIRELTGFVSENICEEPG